MYNIRKIKDEKVWDAFVASVRPSTFLHSWSWGEFERGFGREVFRFGVYDSNNALCAVAQSVRVVARRGTFLLCTHGPVISTSADFGSVMTAISDELVRLARENACVFLRISTSVIETPERVALFKKLGYRDSPIHTHSKLSWILDLTAPEEKILDGMKKNTRYSIRKAERDGITIRSSADPVDLETFWAVYEKTFKGRGFVPYSKDFIRKEFAEFSKSGSAQWYFAEYRGEVVSAALVIFTPWSGFYHHGASSANHHSITPSELLQWHIIRDAKKRGCSKYNFWGIVPEEDKHHPWAGFSRFKRSFGGYPESYVHAQDYRLSWRYWMTYAIEKVRKWRRGV